MGGWCLLHRDKNSSARSLLSFHCGDPPENGPMSSIQVSRLLRVAIESSFAADFAGYLADACSDFGIPDLAYEINFREFEDAPQNFYRGDWTLDGLMATREPELPALAMW